MLEKIAVPFGRALRSTFYCKPVKKVPVVQECFAKPLKDMIEENPPFGYGRVAGLLEFNKNIVQRIFQLKGRQVMKRPVGFRPQIKGLPSVAAAPDEQWSIDLCRVWAGSDSCAVLAAVIDCHTRELLGWHLPRFDEARSAEAALEEALIARYGTLGKVKAPFLLRSDNGLVFASRSYTALVKSYGLLKEFITPHCLQQNVMIERIIRTEMEQCVHRYRFETIQYASRVIGEWITYSNHLRPNQAIGMKSQQQPLTNTH